MRRATLFNIALVLTASVATQAPASTFEPTPWLAEQGIDVLTRQTANEMVDRDLFGAPWATAVVGHVDVYEGFPYLESRWFQIVSDPEWGRLLHGEVGQGLDAFDGEGTSFGALKSPHGLSTDGYSRVFVADTGNDRVLAFRVVTEFDRMELVPEFEVTGLASPFDVAFSDGGTPFSPRTTASTWRIPAAMKWCRSAWMPVRHVSSTASGPSVRATAPSPARWP